MTTRSVCRLRRLRSTPYLGSDPSQRPNPAHSPSVASYGRSARL